MVRAKYFMAAILIIMLIIPVAAEKTKTTEFKDGILTDLKLHYTMTIPDNWKAKTYKESPDVPGVLRALLSQKNYMINKQTEELDGDYTIPEIQIYARQDTISLEGFVEKLKSDIAARKSDDDIINQLNLVLAGEFVQAGEFYLAGQPAYLTFFKRNWERHLQAEPDDPRYRHTGGLIVQNIHDVHEVYVFKHEGYLFVIQAFCETEFYHNMLKDEFARIIGSIKFEDAGQGQEK